MIGRLEKALELPLEAVGKAVLHQYEVGARGGAVGVAQRLRVFAKVDAELVAMLGREMRPLGRDAAQQAHETHARGDLARKDDVVDHEAARDRADARVKEVLPAAEEEALLVVALKDFAHERKRARGVLGDEPAHVGGKALEALERRKGRAPASRSKPPSQEACSNVRSSISFLQPDGRKLLACCQSSKRPVAAAVRRSSASLIIARRSASVCITVMLCRLLIVVVTSCGAPRFSQDSPAHSGPFAPPFLFFALA